MRRKMILCTLAALLCACSMVTSAAAVQVECDAAYCFSAADFSAEEELAGICITGLPDSTAGTVMLGQRILQPGDILTAEQVSRMTFHPLQTEVDLQAQMTYLPIYKDRVESVATMSVAVIGKTNQAPVAEDSAMETYKNLPNEAVLKVKDPEGQQLTFTVTRQPKRGLMQKLGMEVVGEDGPFVHLRGQLALMRKYFR